MQWWWAVIFVVVALAFLVWPFASYLRNRRSINAQKAPAAAVERAKTMKWDEDEED